MNDGLSLYPPSWGRFMPCGRNEREKEAIAVAELFWQ
jgi:hypothetical protein